MEIKYNLGENYFKYYNEANGIIFLKNKLKKKQNIKIRSYTSNIILLLLECTISLVAMIIFFSVLGMMPVVTFLIKFSGYIDLFFLILLLLPIIAYMNETCNTREGTIEIKSSGILDKAESGISMEFSYKNLDLIVVTKNLIVILTKSPFFIIIKNENKERVIEEINRYSDVPIYDSTKN